MLVAFCIDKYFPFGGLQRDFLRIAVSVAKRGHNVRVYTRQWEGDIPKGFEIIKVPTRSWSNHGKGRDFYCFVKSHINSHPVQKLVGFNKMPDLDFYFAGDVCYAERTDNKGLLYRLSARYRHYIEYERAVFEPGMKCKILFLVPNQKQAYQRYYHTENNRFYFLPPGIDRNRRYDHRSPDTRLKFRQKHSVSDDEFLLLQVCSNFELKGVDRSLKAIASLPPSIKSKVKFFVVGGDDIRVMKQLAKKLSIDHQVTFLGGRDDVADIMLASDLMLHPARREAAGIVILEAIVSTLPIVVSSNCGYSHYVIKANSGVVIEEPFDQQDYNKVVLSLLSDGKLRAQYKQNALSFTNKEDLYSLPDFAANIILS